jgi:hypothetical protein
VPQRPVHPLPAQWVALLHTSKATDFFNPFLSLIAGDVLLPGLSEVGHYVVPSLGCVAEYGDLLSELRGLVFLQSVVGAAERMAAYHVKDLLRDSRRRAVLFSNEFCAATYAPMEDGEALATYRARLTRLAALWYRTHLQAAVPVVVLAADAAEATLLLAAGGPTLADNGVHVLDTAACACCEGRFTLFLFSKLTFLARQMWRGTTVTTTHWRCCRRRCTRRRWHGTRWSTGLPARWPYPSSGTRHTSAPPPSTLDCARAVSRAVVSA